MAEFLVKTRGGASPKNKPRVYFTCHREDFSLYFNRICEDIFKTHDPAIYYTKDMNEPLDRSNIDIDLGRMNLFIVPVSLRLLKDRPRAMTTDIAFAKEHNIPILPFVMEPEIDDIYSSAENFGKRQYLSPNGYDATAISYEEKLRKSLDSILISDEMAGRIRAAFDAYVFLSYRKKDRGYANELMKIIHRIPGCRDIAVWYDEFLIPGESFIDNIERAMEQSKLVTLLVTPSLLEAGNFVMTEEYPAALRMGKEVLPTEMVATNHSELKEKFGGIPDPISTGDRLFSDAFLNIVKSVAIRENDSEPEHNFLIGLAYLEGIDVEVDTARGIELITKAAEAELPEAMEKLRDMYFDGRGVEINYREAAKWAELLGRKYTETLGAEHPKALDSLNVLAVMLEAIGDHQSCIELTEELYGLFCHVHGKEHPETVNLLDILAAAYADIGNYDKALKISKEACELQEKILRKASKKLETSVSPDKNSGGTPHVISARLNLVERYIETGDYQSAHQLCGETFVMCKDYLGDDHIATITCLGDLAVIYNAAGEYRDAFEINEMLYRKCRQIFGEGNPKTLTYLNNLSTNYASLGDYNTALSLSKRTYDTCMANLGESHRQTLTALSNTASIYSSLGDHRRALETNERVYSLRCRIFGENHPDTLLVLNNIAFAYFEIENLDMALKMFTKTYQGQLIANGSKHPNTLTTLSNLAGVYSRLDNHSKACTLFDEVYRYRCETLGGEHPDTINALHNYASETYYTGDLDGAYKLFEQAYKLSCKVLGRNHPDTLTTMEFYEGIKNERRQNGGFFSRLFGR